MFFIIPIAFGWLTYYAYEPDLDGVDCEGITCENDEFPEAEIDKFDLKMQATPGAPWGGNE